jgi:hypothetical protein
MEIRKRTPAEVRECLEGSAELLRLLPDESERHAFIEQTVAAAAAPRERIPVPDLEWLDPSTLRALPGKFPHHRHRWAPYDGPPQ